MRRQVGSVTYAAYAAAAWVVLMLIAALEYLLRVNIVTPMFGGYCAFALSVVVMVSATALVAWRLAAHVIPPDEMLTWVTGFFWVIGTISFQVVFIRLVGGEFVFMLAQNDDLELLLGREFVIPAVLVMSFAPWLFEAIAARRESE